MGVRPFCAANLFQEFQLVFSKQRPSCPASHPSYIRYEITRIRSMHNVQFTLFRKLPVSTSDELADANQLYLARYLAQSLYAVGTWFFVYTRVFRYSMLKLHPSPDVFSVAMHSRSLFAHPLVSVGLMNLSRKSSNIDVRVEKGGCE